MLVLKAAILNNLKIKIRKNYPAEKEAPGRPPRSLQLPGKMML